MKNEGKEEDEEGEKKLETHVHLCCIFFLFFLILEIHEWLFFYFLNENYTVSMSNHLSDLTHRL